MTQIPNVPKLPQVNQVMLSEEAYQFVAVAVGATLANLRMMYAMNMHDPKLEAGAEEDFKRFTHYCFTIWIKDPKKMASIMNEVNEQLRPR